MKIFIPNESKQAIGGGWTFLRNFEKYANRKGLNVTNVASPDVDFAKLNENKDGVMLISGATMTTREMVQNAKKAGMKIVLRVDNAPRNSRNRNTGTSRLYDFAQMADMIVYQSNWAKMYLSPFLNRYSEIPEPVIINGADHEIFNTTGPARPKDGEPQFMYAQYNRDETKRWHEAWYECVMANRQWPKSHLWLIGNFSAENAEYNFDFFMGEKFEYLGVMDNPNDFAEALRGTDWLLIPYYNDACSNTLVEARLCGVEKIHYSVTGGNLEIMAAPLEFLTAERMTNEYIDRFQEIL